jgi:hypothetical protein
MRLNWKAGLAVLGLALVAASVAVAQVTWPYSTYLPIVRKDPSPTPTITPTPTPTPVPTSTSTPVPCPSGTPVATQFYNSNGIVGVYFYMKDGRNCFNPNEDAWFKFMVANNNPNAVSVAALGAHYCTVNPPGWRCTQSSWADFSFPANSSIEWEDHLNMPSSGQLQVRLGICWLANKTICEQQPGQWTYLSNSFTVTIR